jgi:hypothetical protein
MSIHQGIAVDALAKVEGQCAMECELVGDEAQFELGSGANSTHLVFTENGLTNLVPLGLSVLNNLRTREVPVGE